MTAVTSFDGQSHFDSEAVYLVSAREPSGMWYQFAFLNLEANARKLVDLLTGLGVEADVAALPADELRQYCAEGSAAEPGYVWFERGPAP